MQQVRCAPIKIGVKKLLDQFKLIMLCYRLWEMQYLGCLRASTHVLEGMLPEVASVQPKKTNEAGCNLGASMGSMVAMKAPVASRNAPDATAKTRTASVDSEAAMPTKSRQTAYHMPKGVVSRVLRAEEVWDKGKTIFITCHTP